MLGRPNRFHGLGSLRNTYKSGRTVRVQHLSMKYALNARRRNFRCAVVVSKKVNKSAVVRNRIRRRIMEQVRSNAANITGPYDLVVTVFSDTVAKMPASELTENIDTLLKQAGVIAS